jgi:hypothetical protein
MRRIWYRALGLLIILCFALAASPYPMKRFLMSSAYSTFVPAPDNAVLEYEEFQVVPVAIGSYILRMYRVGESPQDAANALLDRMRGIGWSERDDGDYYLDDISEEPRLIAEVTAFPSSEFPMPSFVPYGVIQQLSTRDTATYITLFYQYTVDEPEGL